MAAVITMPVTIDTVYPKAASPKASLVVTTTEIIDDHSDDSMSWQGDTEQIVLEPTRHDRLMVNQVLQHGHFIVSPNGRFRMVFQSDGNLVLYDGDKPKWSSNTAFDAKPTEVRMCDNDNLVVGSRASPDWSSGTRRRRGDGKASLIVQDSGNAIIESDGITIWSTDGKGVKSWEPSDLTAVKPGSDRIKSGEYLAVDESIVSPNGQYSATLQSDGNLVLRRIPTNTTLWATYIAPHNSTIKLALGYDSNLVIYGSNSTKLWSTGTKREDHGRLIIGNNGNLILQRDWMNSALWHTNTIFPASTRPVSSLKAGELLSIDQTLVSNSSEHTFGFTSSATFFTRNKLGQTTYHYNNYDTPTDAKTLCFTDWRGEIEIQDSNRHQLWQSVSRESRMRDAEREGRRDAKDRRAEQPVLRVRDDGDVVLHIDEDDVWVLSSLPSGPAPKMTIRGSALKAGESMDASQTLRSQNGKYSLGFRPDGNLVLSDGLNRMLWITGTQGSTLGRLELREDGDLVVCDESGDVKWSSNTAGKGTGKDGITLVLHDDGDAVIYAGGKSIWSNF